MQVTLLGTGSPLPLLERKGTSIVLTVDNEPVLVDCGPGTVHRLVQHEVPPQDIETLFFTHHHMDHNADFFEFAITSWSLGRDALTIYGPPETEDLLESLYTVYEEDLKYRNRLDYPDTGMYDIEWIRTNEGTVAESDSLRVTALEVEHSIETYAYRFEETESGATVVFSGDTRMMPELGEFAAGADVLIQDCCIGPVAEEPPEREGLVWEHSTRPLTEKQREVLGQTHCNPEEAGELASLAGVDTLVLTHLLPYRDTEGMEKRASNKFDGTVHAGVDGMTLEVPPE